VKPIFPTEEARAAYAMGWSPSAGERVIFTPPRSQWLERHPTSSKFVHIPTLKGQILHGTEWAGLVSNDPESVWLVQAFWPDGSPNGKPWYACRRDMFPDFGSESEEV